MPWRKLIRFGLLLAARLAGAASLFAVNLLIVRHLGFEALASYAVFVSLVSVLAVIISSGFTAIAPIFVAEYLKRQNPGLLKGFAITALKQGGLLLAALGFVLLLIWYVSEQLPFIDGFEMGPVVLVTATATAILGFNSAVLVGMKKQVAALIPETFMRPVIFLILAGLLLTSGLATSITAILWLFALSVWLTFAGVLWRDRNMHRGYSHVQQIKERIRWRNACLPWMGITLLWDFMIDLVLLLISFLAGSLEIAVLHICFRYRALAGFGMRTIHTLLMPEITEQAVAGNPAGVQRKLFQVNLASLVYSFSVITCFALFGTWLLGMFSIDVDWGVSVLLVVCATMVIRAIFGPAPLILAINDFHLITLITSLICMVFATVFILVAFPYYGVMSAAVGYTGANLMISATLWYATRKKTGIDCSIFGMFAKIAQPLSASAK